MRQFVTCFLALIGGLGSVMAQPDCVLKKEADSIRIYTCSGEASKVRAVKALFRVNASLSRLTGLLMDAKSFKEWQFNTPESRVLEQKSESQLIYYAIVTAPWPVTDRDMVSEISAVQDPATHVVTIKAAIIDGYLPEKEDMTRVPISNATWILTAVGVNKTNIEYHLDIDPGGTVPAWMINLFSTQAPYESFKNLKKKILDKKFDKTTVTFVKDFGK